MPNPYLFTTDLPESLRETLSPQLQQLFIDTFRAAYELTNDELRSYQTAWVHVFQTAIPGEIMPANSMPNMLPTSVSPAAPSASAVAAAGVPLSETKGYWVDLQSVKLNDDDTSWIQAMPIGTWHHPKFGKIDLTPEKLQEFAKNVNDGVRGQDLDIDYDHKEFGGGAAGWVKAAMAKADGLWLQVQWTRKAAQEIRERVYRYFSPEFMDEWEEPRSKKKVKNVLLGGALTNRPFLKGILPVNLSEVLSTKAHNDSHNGGNMDWKEIAKLLGLPENTPEDQVKAEFQKRLVPVNSDSNNGDNGNNGDSNNGNGDTGNGQPAPQGQPTPQDQPQGQPAPQGQPQSVAASDGRLTPEILRLAETDPIVKALTDRIGTLEVANKMSSIDVKLNELDSDTVAIAPAVKTKLREFMLEAPMALGEKMYGLVKELSAQGVGAVPLTEGGHIDHTNNSSSAVKRFTDKVDALMQKNKDLDYVQASEIIANEDPRLFTEYRNESFIKEGAK